MQKGDSERGSWDVLIYVALLVSVPGPARLGKLTTEKMRQMLCDSIGMSLHGQEGERNGHIFGRAFVDKRLTIGQENDTSYIQKALDNKIV